MSKCTMNATNNRYGQFASRTRSELKFQNMGGMYGGMGGNQNDVNRIRGELQRAQSQEQVLLNNVIYVLIASRTALQV